MVKRTVVLSSRSTSQYNTLPSIHPYLYSIVQYHTRGTYLHRIFSPSPSACLWLPFFRWKNIFRTLRKIELATWIFPGALLMPHLVWDGGECCTNSIINNRIVVQLIWLLVTTQLVYLSALLFCPLAGYIPFYHKREQMFIFLSSSFAVLVQSSTPSIPTSHPSPSPLTPPLAQ